MIQKKVRILGMLSAMLCCGAVSAQQHEVEMIPFGNMDQWIDRQIKVTVYFFSPSVQVIMGWPPSFQAKRPPT